MEFIEKVVKMDYFPKPIAHELHPPNLHTQHEHEHY